MYLLHKYSTADVITDFDNWINITADYLFTYDQTGAVSQDCHNVVFAHEFEIIKINSTVRISSIILIWRWFTTNFVLTSPVIITGKVISRTPNSRALCGLMIVFISYNLNWNERHNSGIHHIPICYLQFSCSCSLATKPNGFNICLITTLVTHILQSLDHALILYIECGQVLGAYRFRLMLDIIYPMK